MESRQRVGALVEVPFILRELGQDPAQIFAAAEIKGEDLKDPESWLSFEEVGKLFRACVDTTGCQHFGLLVGQRASTSSLGLVGRLMRNAPTFKQAALDLCFNQPRYVRGSVVYLVIRNETVVWGFGVHHPGMDAVEQFTEGAVAVGANMMRELVDASPDEVLLARRAPRDLAPYRRFFGVIPQFEAEQSALIFSTSLLESPVRGANAEVRESLENAVAAYWAVKEPSIGARVARILHARVLFGEASLGAVANELSMHPRTLNRRLLAEGKSFRDLVKAARFEVARQLLTITNIQVTAIAQALGYAHPSGFTRAFEEWSGVRPSEWPRQSS